MGETDSDLQPGLILDYPFLLWYCTNNIKIYFFDKKINLGIILIEAVNQSKIFKRVLFSDLLDQPFTGDRILLVPAGK